MNITRLLSSLLLVVALCVASVFAITNYSDAQEQTPTCPAGTTLAADGATCLSEAVNDNVVTTTSCTVGVLSDDGQSCIVPRLDAAPTDGAVTPADGTLTAPQPVFTG